MSCEHGLKRSECYVCSSPKRGDWDQAEENRLFAERAKRVLSDALTDPMATAPPAERRAMTEPSGVGTANDAVLWLAPICEGCRNARAGECRAPGCAFIRMRTPTEWPLDTRMLAPAAVREVEDFLYRLCRILDSHEDEAALAAEVGGYHPTDDDDEADGITFGLLREAQALLDKVNREGGCGEE